MAQSLSEKEKDLYIQTVKQMYFNECKKNMLMFIQNVWDAQSSCLEKGSSSELTADCEAAPDPATAAVASVGGRQCSETQQTELAAWLLSGLRNGSQEVFSRWGLGFSLHRTDVEETELLQKT